MKLERGKRWRCDECREFTHEKSFTKVVIIEPRINLNSETNPKQRWKKKILVVCARCT